MAHCSKHGTLVMTESCPQCSGEQATLSRKKVNRKFEVTINKRAVYYERHQFLVEATSMREARQRAKGLVIGRDASKAVEKGCEQTLPVHVLGCDPVE